MSAFGVDTPSTASNRMWGMASGGDLVLFLIYVIKREAIDAKGNSVISPQIPPAQQRNQASRNYHFQCVFRTCGSFCS